ncbi:MAG: PucR family transcriptional regulator [Firmicutes bacterium]|nr:PucR family transcriptional regulator [Bacillota bacterium]
MTIINIKNTLLTINKILEKKIFLLSSNLNIYYPNDKDFDLDIEDIGISVGQNCNGYNIYEISYNMEKYYVCIEAAEYSMDKSIQLALSMIESAISKSKPLNDLILRIINNQCSKNELNLLKSKFEKKIKGYFILIKYHLEYKDEFHQIIVNSINTQFIIDHNEYFITISDENDIENACHNLSENILTELLYEPTIAISDKINSIENLYFHYNNCLEILRLKEQFNILDYVINYDQITLYRIISNLDSNVKHSVYKRIFNESFLEILDSEMENTIEVFFENNLNLTDTANSICIHRNTLLYRLDKIHSASGFDIRKFKESMIFKIAWLIRKENTYSKSKPF